MKIGHLKFYEEATSLKGHSGFLRQLIHRWNANRQAFQVGPNHWYVPTKEEIYLIIGLLRRGEDFPLLPEVPVGYAAGSQLVYSQRYISDDILSPTDFQVSSGQLCIASFGVEEVSHLSLFMTSIAHHTIDGQCIIFPHLFYVDSLLQAPRLVRWSANFLPQFCIALDRFHSQALGRVNLPFASEFFFLFF